MAGDNDTEKKGFSGLVDMVSMLSDQETIKSDLKAEAKPSTPKHPSQPQRETVPSEPERKTTSSPPHIETVSSGKSGGGSGAKWILGIVGVIFVIWFYNGGQSNKKNLYTPPSASPSYNYSKSNSSTPAVQTPSIIQSPRLQYKKPPVGTNKILSIQEIRYCVREKIRIDAINNILNNSLVNKYNEIVNDYNMRCGRYRYYGQSQTQAERDVEPYRSSIISEAIREVNQINNNIQHIDLREGEQIHYRDWSAQLYWRSFPVVVLSSNNTSGNTLLVSFYRYGDLFFRMSLTAISSYIPSKNDQIRINIYIDNKYITTSMANILQQKHKLEFEIDIDFNNKLLELFKKGKEVQFSFENENIYFCSFSLHGFTKLYNIGISELYKK